MNEELRKCCELLGVAPGTNGRELKQAYLDLAKVWHPDRFSHDPRLQQKAQEKLKEINEAYDRLKSGKAPRPAPPPDHTYAPPAAVVRRRRTPFVLPLALVFCAAFVAALSALAPQWARQTRPQTPTAEQEASRPAKEAQRPESVATPSANPSARGNERTARKPPTEATSAGAPGAEPSAQPLRPMPTVTVNIDSVTGLLATADCPNVSRMTYPAGDEPKRYCTTQHKTKVTPQSELPGPKDSRIKSVAKRLASPSK